MRYNTIPGVVVHVDVWSYCMSWIGTWSDSKKRNKVFTMLKESKKKYYDDINDVVKNKKQGDMVFFTSKEKWLLYTPEKRMNKV